MAKKRIVVNRNKRTLLDPICFRTLPDGTAIVMRRRPGNVYRWVGVLEP